MKRSKHSLSQYRLTSLNQGVLYPVACEEVLPGDSFRWQSSALLRVSPLVSPVMHPVHACIHHWYVPNRLIWSNWEPFITGRDPALTVPVLGVVMNSNPPVAYLARALGIGADSTAGITVNALPFRAYNFIWNEFYRDQNLDTKVVERRGDTGDVGGDYKLLNCRWEKDYFTVARPNPQQGTGVETVPITLSGIVPVSGLGSRTQTFSSTPVTAFESNGASRSYAFNKNIDQTSVNDQVYMEGTAATGYPKVNVNLSGVTVPAGVDINEWRKSMAMQRIREHRNKFGERYRDYLAFLGVNSSDSRLDRPEYLGGGKQTISFSEVLSTADTGTAPIGEMAGHGIAALRTRPFRRFFEEHGYVISLLFLRPVSVYMNRVPRHWLRRDYEQYWQKELEMMGDQIITNTEVYGDTATPSGTFGYTSRYDEYRHAESSVSGEFRNVLNYWHMARIFASQPALNSSFVECDPTDRIYASNVTDEIYAMVSHRISARRLVSKRARN